jgi:hypothetical protein
MAKPKSTCGPRQIGPEAVNLVYAACSHGLVHLTMLDGQNRALGTAALDAEEIDRLFRGMVANLTATLSETHQLQ